MAQDLSIVTSGGRAQLPAHLQAAYAGKESNIIVGERGSSLSIKGKNFHATIDGVTQTLMRKDEDGNELPLQALRVVILDYAVALGRTYFEGAYDPNSTTSPACWSFDSIAPEDDVPDKQSLKCSTCPLSQKGSKHSDNGQAMTACAQHRVVVVVPANSIGAVPALRLRLAQTSNYDGRSPEARAQGKFAFQNYLESLKVLGIPDTRAIVTTMSFDPQAPHPKLQFKAASYVSAEQHAAIEAMMASGQVEEILGRTGTVALAAGKNVRPAPAPETQVVKGATMEQEQRFAGAERSYGQHQGDVIPPERQGGVDYGKAAQQAGIVIDHEPGEANHVYTPEQIKAAVAGQRVPETFSAPIQKPGEDEDDYADRVTKARRAWKAAVLAQIEADKAAQAKASAAPAEFTFREINPGEDEDDYADAKTAARRKWKAEQAVAPAAAAAPPPPFVAPTRNEGEDEDDHADRVTAARRAYKAQYGVAPAAQAAAPAPAPEPEKPSRTRRTRAQIEADKAAEAAKAAGAGTAGATAQPSAADAAAAFASAAEEEDGGAPIEQAPKANGKAGNKAPIEAKPTALPDNVANMLARWDS